MCVHVAVVVCNVCTPYNFIVLVSRGPRTRNIAKICLHTDVPCSTNTNTLHIISTARIMNLARIFVQRLELVRSPVPHHEALAVILHDRCDRIIVQQVIRAVLEVVPVAPIYCQTL
jgi:hypothetical protein